MAVFLCVFMYLNTGLLNVELNIIFKTFYLMINFKIMWYWVCDGG
jgi:hypothetical protein